jgi:hypothetical protein
MKLYYITQELSIEDTKATLRPTVELLKLELQHFAECITEKKKPLLTGIDGIKALKIAEAIMTLDEPTSLSPRRVFGHGFLVFGAVIDMIRIKLVRTRRTNQRFCRPL